MNVVLTGSSSGIGRAIAQRLLAQGHQVWGFARSDQADFVTKHAGAFRASRCDVASWPQVAEAAAEVAAVWPKVDGLIACAGWQGEVGPALQADALQWSATVRTNLDGTYFALRAFAPLLSRAQGRAKVVCFSGGGATKLRINFSAYGVAKTGVVRLVEMIAGEEPGLDINAIAPGAINTAMTDEVIALGPAKVGAAEFAETQRRKQTGGDSLEKALELVDWLLSPASDGISGRLLSAQWDHWQDAAVQGAIRTRAELGTLRRIEPPKAG